MAASAAATWLAAFEASSKRNSWAVPRQGLQCQRSGLMLQGSIAEASEPSWPASGSEQGKAQAPAWGFLPACPSMALRRALAKLRSTPCSAGSSAHGSLGSGNLLLCFELLVPKRR